MTLPRGMDETLADLGCQAIEVDGRRGFRCPWADRFRVAHRLVNLLGSIEIHGEGPTTDERGSASYRFARIEAVRP